VFERGCTEITDPALFTCKDINKNGQNLRYCNCHGDECNADWNSANDGSNDTKKISISALLLMFVIITHFL